MTRANHTPGPWALEAPPVSDPSAGWIVQDADGTDIAEGIVFESIARLIAAAPETTERLRRMATLLSTAASYIARDIDTGIADKFEREANDTRALLARIDGTDEWIPAAVGCQGIPCISTVRRSAAIRRWRRRSVPPPNAI